MANNTVIRILAENDLKITPQRTAVLEVVLSLDNHPTVEEIAQYLRLNYPHVPIGTVYKILERFVKLGIITKVKTDDGVMRYDPVTENHHHLYSPDSERIQDYYDDELHNILDNYLKKKKIPNFEVRDFRLQIIGTFKEKNKQVKSQI